MHNFAANLIIICSNLTFNVSAVWEPHTCCFEDLCENVFGDVFSIFYCCLPVLYPFLSRFTQEFNCILNLLHGLPILGEKLRKKKDCIDPTTLEYLWINYLTAKNGSLRSNTMPLKHSSTAFWKGLSVCFKKFKSTPNAACGWKHTKYWLTANLTFLVLDLSLNKQEEEWNLANDVECDTVDQVMHDGRCFCVSYFLQMVH